LEIAVALQKAGIDYIHFDAGQVGQTVYNFPFETRFFSSSERLAIAGVPLQTVDQAKATREQYLTYLRSVVQMFNLPIRTYERIENIERGGEGFRLRVRGLNETTEWNVRKLVLAAGGTARPRKLGIPGEDQPNVHFGYRDPHIYFRKRLLIVGGRNSAVEAALRCHHLGAHVRLSYRRAALEHDHIKYWLYPEIVGLMNNGQICGHFQTVPIAINAGHVTLRHTVTGERTEVPADFVLVLIGYEADMSLARMAGVELEEHSQTPRLDPHTMQTNVPGVFIAGTAIAGTQDQFRIFIENCHMHAERIVAALTGQVPPESHHMQYARPET
jgi:thioredoxin reductase (NADPH)